MDFIVQNAMIPTRKVVYYKDIVVEHLGEIFDVVKVDFDNQEVEVNNGDIFKFEIVSFLKRIPLDKLKEECVVDKL